MKQKFLKGLDDHQKRVVSHDFDGANALVLAGAGSGKTRAMTHRVSHLVENGVHPKRILAVSFTRKASNELKDRIGRMHSRGFDVQCRTFHSMTFNILRNNGWASEVMDGYEQFKVVRDLMRKTKSFPDDFTPKDALKTFDRARMDATQEEDMEREISRMEPHMTALPGVWHDYVAHKEKRGLVDFADMPWKCWLMFQRRPEILESISNWLSYMIVDEAQDLNKIQFEISEMMVPTAQLMIVGDLKQGIYGFRGADVNRVLDFADRMEMDRMFLETNYRSGQHIVRQANLLMSQTDLAKSCPESKPFSKDKGEIESWLTQGPSHEAEVIARDIVRQYGEGVGFGDMAIIYRTNAQSAAFEHKLMKARIPYHINGAKSFFERKEVMDAMAYAKFALDRTDIESFKRLYNNPCRFLGRVFMSNLMSHNSGSEDLYVSLSSFVDANYSDWRIRRNGGALLDHLDQLNLAVKRNVEPRKFLEMVYDLKSSKNDNSTFYDAYRGDDDEDSIRTENLDSLLDFASKFKTLQEFIGASDEVTPADDNIPDDEKVQLMTVHRSKGLEFRNVYVVGFSEGLFPHHKGDVDEERRVAYVAVTRAENRLVVSSPAVLHSRSCDPSRFVEDMGLNPQPAPAPPRSDEEE
jgi:DNA helicase-2/ATP-dependent DNA helicase PcrA